MSVILARRSSPIWREAVGIALGLALASCGGVPPEGEQRAQWAPGAEVDRVGESASDSDSSALVPNAAPFGFVDVTQYGAVCDGSTNIDSAVQAALAEGQTRLYIPAGCLWQPAGDLIPANLQVRGEDWEQTIISSADPNGGAGPYGGHLALGAWSRVENVAIRATFCTQLIATDTPGSLLDACSVGEYYNSGPAPVILSPWHKNRFVVDVGYAERIGEGDGVENAMEGNGYVVLNRTNGGAYYAQLMGNHALGFHSWPIDDNTMGSLAQIGINHTSIVGATGHKAELYATDPSNRAFYGLRMPGASGSLFEASNLSSGGSDFVSTSASRTSGIVFQGYHRTSAFSGNGLDFDFGNDGGSFTGNFLDFKKATVSQFSVDSDGVATANGVNLNDGGQRPPCDPSRRGLLWMDEGGSGVADTVQICVKDAADRYAWRTVF